MPLPPVTGFSYDKQNSTLSWNSIPDAVKYEVRYKLSTSPNYTQAYYGPNTSCSLSLSSGTYDIQGRGEAAGGGFGLWTDPPEQIVVS